MNDAAGAGADETDRRRQGVPETGGAVHAGPGDVNTVNTGTTASAGSEPAWPGPLSDELAEVQFDASKRVAVNLTHREIRMLAQVHIDHAHGFEVHMKSGGHYGVSDIRRSRYHAERFEELQDLLEEPDRKLFRELCDKRRAYIAIVCDPEDAPVSDDVANRAGAG